MAVLGSVAHEGTLKRLFEKNSIDYVFHAAAYKHVSLAEENPSAAVIANVKGTKILIDFCERYRIKKALFYSTDKAVNPVSVMGATKKIAEEYIISIAANKKSQFYVLRLCNIYDSKGSVVPIFRENIQNKEPVTLSHPEAERMFVDMNTVLSISLSILENEKAGSVFLTTNYNILKIRDIALKLAKEEQMDDVENLIRIGGLKRGERLHEKLCAPEEKLLQSNLKGVLFIKNGRKINVDLMNKCIQEAENCNEEGTINLLKELLPDYRGLNYQRSALDG